MNKSFNLFQIFTIWEQTDPIKTTGWLLGSLPEWIKKGYIDSDVWNRLRDYVDDGLLTPENLHFYKSNEEKQNQEREKLLDGDYLPDDLLSAASRYVDSSKLTEFTLRHLGLKDSHIEMIREDYSDDQKRINFQVEEIYFRISDILHILQVSS